MNALWHRGLTATLGALTGVSALLAATDPEGLAVSDTVWTWVILVLAVTTVVVQGARMVVDPNPTT